VNFKKKARTVGAFTYDEILPRLRAELDALINERKVFGIKYLRRLSVFRQFFSEMLH